MYHVAIQNPETGMIDSTVLNVEHFTVQRIFEAMEARDWHYQPGTYVAIKVEGPESPDCWRIAGHYAPCLTFTVEESERVVTERIAVPS